MKNYQFFKRYYPNDLKMYSYIGCSIGVKGCLLLIPYLTKVLIDQIQYQDLTMFKQTACLLIGSMILFSIFLSAKYYLQNYIEVRVSNEIKREMLFKVLVMKSEVLKKCSLGEVIQKIYNDTTTICPLIISTVVDLTLNIIYVICIIAIMFTLNGMMTFVLLGLIPIFILCYRRYVPKIERTSHQLISSEEGLKSLTEEVMMGNLEIKVNGANAFMKAKINRQLSEYFRLHLRKTKDVMKYDFIFVTGIMNFATLFIYCLGGYFVFNGLITIGTLISFNLYFSKLWDPVESFMTFSKEMKVQQLSLDRIKAFLNLEEENQSGNEELPPYSGLYIKDLSLSYDTRPIFKHLNLELKVGEVIGIRGGNGAGKSTLARLLVKLVDQYEGEIYYGKKNYKDLSTARLREKVVYIPPEAYFFEGSILENVTLTELEAEDKIHVIHQHPLMKILKQNGRTLTMKINDNDVALSSGEQKIVQLMRGLLRQGDVYIFDEPLNYVDASYKTTLIDFIKNEMPGKSVVIISHDEDIFTCCDRVYDLDKLRDSMLQ